ncbi:MAG: CHAT domain-containing protein, partial [Chloroflexales bacterium]|nr:CHAT domain-containing protein [Chloroflexales bacterium]
AQREARIADATKVVPIVRVGSGTAVGAAQVMGPRMQVDKVQAVAEIELNLGNLAERRGHYSEAIAYYAAAAERFSSAGDRRMLAYVQNGLANVLSQQHQFHAAAELYEQALAVAEEVGLEVTRAEIECNLGSTALFQGRYDQALAYLERSRRRYAALDMPHESAVAELELADAYLELNLAAEAAAIYSQVTITFRELGMRAEQARALLNYGRACVRLGRGDEAWALLDEAHAHFQAEGNPIGAAMVILAEASLHYKEGDYPSVIAAALRAEQPLRAASAWSQLLTLRWLAGEAARASGNLAHASQVLSETLRDAETLSAPQIAQRCYTSLGRLSMQEGDRAAAEAALHQATALIDAMRAPLPADELRAALADETLAPYSGLVELCLDDPAGARVAEAIGYAEQGRTRAMIEMLGSAVRLPESVHDSADPADRERLWALRAELNWLYGRLSRPPEGAGSAGDLARLYHAIREREAAVAEVRRRIRRSVSTMSYGQRFDLAALQAELGEESALVEYVELHGDLAAFVVTGAAVRVVRGLGPLAAVEAELTRLHFQLAVFRHGAESVRAHLDTLTARATHHLQKLYDLLLRPIEPLLERRRLVVVPHGALHYVPFHALHDGEGHLVARREICCAPSASVLQHCLALPRAPLRSALILGVADEQAPHARDEARALAPLFQVARTLLDGAATTAALAAAAPAADVLHLACHGHFRPDNPLFSTLRLADGYLTVYDAYSLDLRCQLVTLSACETGVSAVAPGDELMGLARGFFLAGAPSLLVSLWSVDDAATAELMTGFYTALRDGALPCAALRHAQIAAMQPRPHPFFWASFTLLGRW